MKISPFKLERYFSQYEFRVRFLLSPSDCESLAQSELLDMADAESRLLWENLRLSYTESQGHPRLRAEISHLYEAVTPEQILVAAPEEAIFLLMTSLLQRGDEVITLYPAYQSLYEIARSVGCKTLLWNTKLGSSGWQLDLDWLVDHITGRTRLVIVNFPHNPTGFLPTDQEFQAVIDLVARRGIHLFCDEMYRGLEYDPTRRIPSAVDLYERACVLGGLSKTYALPGLRIGWLAAQEASLLQAVQNLKDYTTICHSAPSEILGIIALQNSAVIIQRSLDIIRTNLEAAHAFFGRHSHLFEWLPPLAGSIAFPRYLGPGTVEEFCQSALEQRGVMIVPGSLFDYPGNHFRVGLGRKNFGQALIELEKMLQNNPSFKAS